MSADAISVDRYLPAGQHPAQQYNDFTAWGCYLQRAALACGWPAPDPEDYWDYYEDGYSPEDAWIEDISHRGLRGKPLPSGGGGIAAARNARLS